MPHGVRRVDGVRDPRAARLVLHGWFTEPVPHFEGGLDEAAVEEGLAPAVTALMEAISPPCVVGLLAIRLEVSAEGKVTETIVLSDTLVVDPSQQDEADQCRDGDDERAALLAEVEELGRDLCAVRGGADDGDAAADIRLRVFANHFFAAACALEDLGDVAPIEAGVLVVGKSKAGPASMGRRQTPSA